MRIIIFYLSKFINEIKTETNKLKKLIELFKIEFI